MVRPSSFSNVGQFSEFLKRRYSLYHVEPLFFVLSGHSYIGFHIQSCDNIPVEYPKLFLLSEREEKKMYWVKYESFSFSETSSHQKETKLKTKEPENKCMSGNPGINFLIIYLFRQILVWEVFACSSNVIAFLWSLLVDPVSQQYDVFLVISSIFSGQESSGT